MPATPARRPTIFRLYWERVKSDCWELTRRLPTSNNAMRKRGMLTQVLTETPVEALTRLSNCLMLTNIPTKEAVLQTIIYPVSVTTAETVAEVIRSNTLTRVPNKVDGNPWDKDSPQLGKGWWCIPRKAPDTEIRLKQRRTLRPKVRSHVSV